MPVNTRALIANKAVFPSNGHMFPLDRGTPILPEEALALKCNSHRAHGGADREACFDTLIELTAHGLPFTGKIYGKGCRRLRLCRHPIGSSGTCSHRDDQDYSQTRRPSRYHRHLFFALYDIADVRWVEADLLQGVGPLLFDLTDARGVGLPKAAHVRASVPNRFAPLALLVADPVDECAGLGVMAARLVLDRDEQVLQLRVKPGQLGVRADEFLDMAFGISAVETSCLDVARAREEAAQQDGEGE